MKLLQNSGVERVIDCLREWATPGSTLDLMSPVFSLYAFSEARDFVTKASKCRLLLGDPNSVEKGLFGGPSDIGARGRLQSRWLAKSAGDWLRKSAEVRHTVVSPPQSLIAVSGTAGSRAVTGACAFTSEGLGITPSDQLGLVQAAEDGAESLALSNWFQSIWNALKQSTSPKDRLVEMLDEAASHRSPRLVYLKVLFELFRDSGDVIDEDQIIKSATGIRQTNVWKKLFKFQRDGVVGAIDKLERLGGCIIADSVGLGKTFEALAVIKYYELRNDRVLVLCPKRLRDNWTLYKANDRRNVLAGDRLSISTEI